MGCTCKFLIRLVCKLNKFYYVKHNFFLPGFYNNSQLWNSIFKRIRRAIAKYESSTADCYRIWTKSSDFNSSFFSCAPTLKYMYLLCIILITFSDQINVCKDNCNCFMLLQNELKIKIIFLNLNSKDTVIWRILMRLFYFKARTGHQGLNLMYS